MCAVSKAQTLYIKWNYNDFRIRGLIRSVPLSAIFVLLSTSVSVSRDSPKWEAIYLFLKRNSVQQQVKRRWTRKSSRLSTKSSRLSTWRTRVCTHTPTVDQVVVASALCRHSLYLLFVSFIQQLELTVVCDLHKFYSEFQITVTEHVSVCTYTYTMLCKRGEVREQL